MMLTKQIDHTINRAMLLLGILFAVLTALTVLLPQHAYATILSDTVVAVLLVFLYLVKPSKK
ncbi:MAG: hypothetical protein QXE12_00010 [Conexivisphaerales archaeon]